MSDIDNGTAVAGPVPAVATATATATATVDVDVDVDANGRVLKTKTPQTAGVTKQKLERANDISSEAMFWAYNLGSLATIFHFATLAAAAESESDDTDENENDDTAESEDSDTEYALDIRHQIIEFFELSEDIPLSEVIFGLAWNSVDASLFIDGCVDWRNKDKNWAYINWLNSLQLLGFTAYGFALEWGGEEVAADIEIGALEAAGIGGGAIGVASFAACMFLYAAVSSYKQREAENLIAKLDAGIRQGKFDENTQLKDLDADHQDVANRIDAIRRSRCDKPKAQQTGIEETQDLSVKQARLILKNEALYQKKAVQTWTACGVATVLALTAGILITPGVNVIFTVSVFTMVAIGYSMKLRKELRQESKKAAADIENIITTGTSARPEINDTTPPKSWGDTMQAYGNIVKKKMTEVANSASLMVKCTK